MLRFHAISRLDGSGHDGIHLLWSPPYPSGNALDGFTILRRGSQGKTGRDCLTLTPSILEAARQLGHVSLGDVTVWCRVRVLGPSNPLSTHGPPTFFTFLVDLGRTHSMVTISGGPAIAVFAGLPDRTVVAGQVFIPPSVTVHGSGIGVLWIVTRDTKAQLEICGNVDHDRDWQGAHVVVKNLQMPFPSVNPSVPDAAAGRALAESRAQPDPLDGEFDEITRYADAALSRPGGVPAWRVVSERPGGGGDEWDVSPFGLTVAPSILPAWHRALGFSHLDRDGLAAGARYDYRIIGQVRRRDRDERMVDLHTVPRGYRLPRCFRWGPLLAWADPPPVVEAVDGAPGDPGTIRKGIAVERLTLFLDDPVPRIVIEAVPGGSIQAHGFRFGSSVATVAATTSARTSLDFGSDVDRVVIEGGMKLTGVVSSPLDPSLDPDEPVQVTQTILDVAFVPTAPPPAPASVAVTSLGDPARTAVRGVLDTNRGFEITWDAPSTIPAVLLPLLPVDATSAPPTDVARYAVLRSWGSRPFAPGAGDGTHVSGRNAPTPTDTPAWGFDLLRAFPPADQAPGSHSERVHAVELFEPEDLSYGEEIVYRVLSVDAAGRASTPTDSPPVPLRKHVRPPVPTTPPASGPPDPGAVPRSGVDVRLVQPDDPDLTDADRALAGEEAVVRLRWGWGPDQRALDPDVVEFRVYEHDGPLTEISVRTAGPPTAAPSGWTLPVEADRPIAADEFVGVVVVLGAAFRILSHPAGTSVSVSLAPNAVDPTVAPGQGIFTVNRTTSAELNSESWHRRVAIVPRTPVEPTAADPEPVESYEVTLPAGWLAVDASRPRQREAIGVTAADAEAYVPDRRAAVESEPRPGNESTVAAAEVRARYYGRPVLTVADLSDVATLTLPRRAGDEVHGTFRPADTLPPGFAPDPRMLLERIPAGGVLPRLRVSPSAIELLAPDGSAATWPLSDADQAALRAEVDAGRVGDRFLAHAASRLAGLDDAAMPLGTVNPMSPFEDTLPNRPARWLYRLRAVDATGRPSRDGQILPLVVQVPSPARSVAPELESLETMDGTATVRVRARGALDGQSVFLFHAADAVLTGTAATLATIRNRDDLPPETRLVVRDQDGRRLAPTPVPLDADGRGQATLPLPVDGVALHVWALALTADGVPSRLVGPLHAGIFGTGV